jgi:predicted acetyltransferase
MDYDLRYATPDEYPAIAELDGASFGYTFSPEAQEDAKLDLDLDRVLVAVDRDRIVGVSAELPFTMTLPGGEQVPATGLTWVSVEVTHRRRGIVRSLIERQLRAAADDRIPAVILSASEGGIYGRYGFGAATRVRKLLVQRRRARLAAPVDTGRVERMTTERAREVLPALYERWRRTSPGGVTRDERRWQLLLLDREGDRDGRSGLMHLVHPDGYVSYRIRPNWGDGDPQGECFITDYVPITGEAHAALWAVLLSMDLLGSIESYRVPLEDPLPFLLTDPRAVETLHLGDNLWVRPTDVPALLGRRRYGVEVDCVLEVRDALLGDGRYRLRGGPDGAECTRTDAAPDVVLTVADLGALSLGGLRLHRLVRAGVAECADAAVLRRLDLALLADREPVHGTSF